MVDMKASPLWTVVEIASAVKASTDGSDAEIDSISIDSRTLSQGALYVAIQGVSQDGHKFVSAAFKAGAVAALVHEDYRGSENDGILIRVKDTLRALEKLGKAARERTKAKVIAVTGSAGKTGTKDALRAMLAPSGKVHVSVKSFNNHWGVPLSLARMPRDTEFAVFEVGMNHAGEIEPLSKLIQPDVAIITTVAPVHIGHFNNEEEIAVAKAEIFAGLKEDGGALLPLDNKHFDLLKSCAEKAGVSRIFSFGKSEGADFHFLDIACGLQKTKGRMSLLGKQNNFHMSIPGEHIALNLLGALAAVHLVGGDEEQAIGVLNELEPTEGRGVIHHLSCQNGDFTLIDESYNANPASMEIALKNLSLMNGNAYFRRIAVLGDMLELGSLSKFYHIELSKLINGMDIDLVFVGGEMMVDLFEGLSLEKRGAAELEADDLIEPIADMINPGDVIMVKGSQASNMGLVVKGLLDRFGG